MELYLFFEFCKTILEILPYCLLYIVTKPMFIFLIFCIILLKSLQIYFKRKLKNIDNA